MNTVEPFKNVRLNDKVLDYLRNNNLKRFVPRNLEGEAETETVIRIVTFSPHLRMKLLSYLHLRMGRKKSSSLGGMKLLSNLLTSTDGKEGKATALEGERQTLEKGLI